MSALMEKLGPGFVTAHGEEAIARLSHYYRVRVEAGKNFTVRSRGRKIGRLLLTDHVVSPCTMHILGTSSDSIEHGVQLWIVHEGNVHFEYRRKEASASAGDLCAFTSDSSHRAHYRNAVRILGVLIPREIIPETDQQVRKLANPILPRTTFTKAASAYFAKLIQSDDDRVLPTHLEAEVELIAASLINACFFQANRMDIGEGNNHDIHGKIQYLVERHYKNPDFKPATIARMLHMSTRQLYRLHQDQDLTLAQKISVRRLQAAKQLIDKDPDVPLQEVAQVAGFSSLATMRDAFKAHLDTLPSEYALLRKNSATVEQQNRTET